MVVPRCLRTLAPLLAILACNAPSLVPHRIPNARGLKHAGSGRA